MESSLVGFRWVQGLYKVRYLHFSVRVFFKLQYFLMFNVGVEYSPPCTILYLCALMRWVSLRVSFILNTFTLFGKWYRSGIFFEPRWLRRTEIIPNPTQIAIPSQNCGVSVRQMIINAKCIMALAQLFPRNEFESTTRLIWTYKWSEKVHESTSNEKSSI